MDLSFYLSHVLDVMAKRIKCPAGLKDLSGPGAQHEYAAVE